jgi:hypothetical protein
MLQYTKQLTKVRHTEQGQNLREGSGFASIGPALRQLLGGTGRQLNDHIGLSLLGERAEQGKHLALEGVMGSRDLNELARWRMLVCSMLIRVATAMSAPASRSPPTWHLPTGPRS